MVAGEAWQSMTASDTQRLIVKHTFLDFQGTASPAPADPNIRKSCSDPALYEKGLMADDVKECANKPADGGDDFSFDLVGLSDQEAEGSTATQTEDCDNNTEAEASRSRFMTHCTMDSPADSFCLGTYMEQQPIVPVPIGTNEQAQEQFTQLAADNARLQRENQLLAENARLAMENKRLREEMGMIDNGASGGSDMPAAAEQQVMSGWMTPGSQASADEQQQQQQQQQAFITPAGATWWVAAQPMQFAPQVAIFSAGHAEGGVGAPQQQRQQRQQLRRQDRASAPGAPGTPAAAKGRRRDGPSQQPPHQQHLPPHQRRQQKFQQRQQDPGMSLDNAEFDYTPECDVNDRTTVMLRNLPNNYTRAMLLQLLDSEGFQGQYDFVYLPIDFSTHACLGYAFVNLIHPSVVQPFWKTFDGFSEWVLPSRKVCYVSWCGPHQGFHAHVERYRNSPVMHPSVNDEYKPLIFVDGVRADFPPPKRKTRAPRVRNLGGPHGGSPSSGQGQQQSQQQQLQQQLQQQMQQQQLPMPGIPGAYMMC